jgi:hypothetical protein
MKRMLAGLTLVLGTAALSGCYYDPDYSYVRGNGYQGDAYYGEGPSVIYEPDVYGYYGPGWGYYGGCCYSSGVSVGVSGTWYGGSHHYRGRDRDWRGDRDRYRGEGDRRSYRDRRDGDRRSDRGRDRDHDRH